MRSSAERAFVTHLRQASARALACRASHRLVGFAMSIFKHLNGNSPWLLHWCPHFHLKSLLRAEERPVAPAVASTSAKRLPQLLSIPCDDSDRPSALGRPFPNRTTAHAHAGSPGCVRCSLEISWLRPAKDKQSQWAISPTFSVHNGPTAHCKLSM